MTHPSSVGDSAATDESFLGRASTAAASLFAVDGWAAGGRPQARVHEEHSPPPDPDPQPDTTRNRPTSPFRHLNKATSLIFRGNPASLGPPPAMATARSPRSPSDS